MRTIIIYLSTLLTLLLFAEIGQTYTHFIKEGSFIAIFITCNILSIIITICNNIWFNNHEEKRFDIEQIKLRQIEAETYKLKAEGDLVQTRYKYDRTKYTS